MAEATLRCKRIAARQTDTLCGYSVLVVTLVLLFNLPNHGLAAISDSGMSSERGWKVSAQTSVLQSSFVYTLNGGSAVNTVSGFSVGATGALATIPGSPFPTGGGSGGFFNDIRVSPNGNFLFASNDRDASISVFSINSITGSLTPVSGSPFQSGTGVSFGSLGLALSSDGRLLFAANTLITGKLAVFTVAPTGALTAIAGSPFSGTNLGLTSITLSADDRFLFLAQNSDRVDVRSVASDGALTPVTGSPFQTQPDRPVDERGDIVSIAINCSRTFVFAGLVTGEIAVLNIAANGALSPVSGSPFGPVSLGDELVMNDPTSGLLFASNRGLRTISAMNVSTTGSLSVVPGSTVFLGDNNNEDRIPIDMDVNREGTLIYVMNADSTVHVLNKSPKGMLALVPGSPFVNMHSGFGAMLAAAPPGKCSGSFDLCVQDDSSTGVLKLNSTTGDYEFTNCAGVVLGGTGALRIKGCSMSLEDIRPDRRLLAKMDRCSMKATASLQVFAQGRTFSITDRNTSNNTCSCH